MPRGFWAVEDVAYVLAQGIEHQGHGLTLHSFIYRSGELEPTGFVLKAPTGQMFALKLKALKLKVSEPALHALEVEQFALDLDDIERLGR